LETYLASKQSIVRNRSILTPFTAHEAL